MKPKNIAISRFSRWARKASEIYLRASEKTAGESLTGLFPTPVSKPKLWS